MIGKIVASIVLLALAAFVGALLYTDQTPSQLIHSITSRMPHPGGGASSGNVASLSYHYHLEAEGLEPLDYTVRVRVVSRNQSSICFQYQVTGISQGSLEDARDFMYGYMGYRAENETICTPLNPGDFIAKYYFTDPRKTGTAKLTYGSDRGLHGEAEVANGIVREMRLEGAAGGRHVELHIELAGITRSGSTGTNSGGGIGGGEAAAATRSRSSLESLTYRATWRIGSGNGAREIQHLLVIHVQKYDGRSVCYTYEVTGATGTQLETARMLVEQLYMGKPEGSVICVSTTSTQFSPQHLIYPSRMRGTHRLSGSGEEVTATINGNGILSTLKAKGYVDTGDNETIPLELTLKLEEAR